MQDTGRQKEDKALLAEADRRIEELRAVLADMDEIAALRRRRGEPESDDYNGFRRSDVLELLGQQQERRAALVAGLQQSAEEVPKERTSLSAALEKLYEALSADVGRARRDVLQELKFYSRQTSAAYDELSLVIDALADRVAERVIERLGGLASVAAPTAGADAAQGEKSAFPANAPEHISEEESAAEDISEQAPAAGNDEGALSEAPQKFASEGSPEEGAEAPEEASAESSGAEAAGSPAGVPAEENLPDEASEEAPAQEAGAEEEAAQAPEEGAEDLGEQIQEEEPAGPQGGAPEEK